MPRKPMESKSREQAQSAEPPELSRRLEANEDISTHSHIEQMREQHLHKYFQETDKAAVEQLSARFGHLVPEERVQAMKELPTKFEGSQKFDEELRTQGQEQPTEGTVTGWSLGTHEAAHVQTEHLQVPKTIYHERLHQLSDPEGTRKLGELTADPDFKEGLTEHYAIRELGIEPPTNTPTAYAERRVFAAKLEQALGQEKLERLYFQGDIAETDAEQLSETAGKLYREELNRKMTELSRDNQI